MQTLLGYLSDLRVVPLYYAILLIIILGELLGELNYIIVRFLLGHTSHTSEGLVSLLSSPGS